jgi:hypothetical protein
MVKYVLVPIDHYSKWCEAQPVKEHDVKITINFWKMKLLIDMGCLSKF